MVAVLEYASQKGTSRCPSHTETSFKVVGGMSYTGCAPQGMGIEEHIGSIVGSFTGYNVDRFHPISYTSPADASLTSAAALAAQKVIDDAYAATVAAAKEAKQLLWKKELLENPILMWEPGLKETLTTETNVSIDEYNKKAKELGTTAKETAEAVAETVKKSATIPILIVVGVLATIYIFIFARR